MKFEFNWWVFAVTVIIVIAYYFYKSRKKKKEMVDTEAKEIPAFVQPDFNEELERYTKLQQIAGTYMLFKFYIKDQEDWEFAENVENDDDWIILHPYPEVAPSHCYYIRYTGSDNLSIAVDDMMNDFLLNEENRHYREII